MTPAEHLEQRAALARELGLPQPFNDEQMLLLLELRALTAQLTTGRNQNVQI